MMCEGVMSDAMCEGEGVMCEAVMCEGVMCDGVMCVCDV